jgi:hypothetical protein
MKRNSVPLIVLAGVWVVVIAVVNPVGEFTVNDDWSFVKILESLSDKGRMIATGWGHGGPSAIVHVLWGGLVTGVAGYSLTALRVSVLIAAVLGSFGLLALLRSLGASPALALLGTLAVVLNPLFMSQSFTFMTDITFATLVVFAVLLLHLGVKKSRISLIAAGLCISLAATLTRQIGLVVPVGFVVVSLVHPAGKLVGRGRAVVLAAVVAVLPWLAYEMFLSRVGSTPVVQHERILKIFLWPLEKGFPDYLIFMGQLFFLCGLGYVAFFVSPLLVVRYREHLAHRPFRILVLGLTGLFAVAEALVLTGTVQVPIILWRNVLIDLGIGPILLKDTYILGIHRTVSLPGSVYCAVLYWTAVAFAVLGAFMLTSLWRFFRVGPDGTAARESFTGTVSLVAGLGYLGIITLTCFHDRYLIPVLILVTIWLVSDRSSADRGTIGYRRLVPGFVFIALLGLFSTFATRDFMEMKRSLKQAQDYLVHDLKVDPCNVDGGFEFNGYHCARGDFNAVKGLSWWWVSREDYALTLGPLPGYQTVRTFPFQRILGNPGAVHVLQPLTRGDG